MLREHRERAIPHHSVCFLDVVNVERGDLRVDLSGHDTASVGVIPHAKTVTNIVSDKQLLPIGGIPVPSVTYKQVTAPVFSWRNGGRSVVQVAFVNYDRWGLNPCEVQPNGDSGCDSGSNGHGPNDNPGVKL